MASNLIGRMACPECGFAAAHVKIKSDKEGANPYRHCPDCGAQFFTRTKAQGDALRKKMRPEGADVIEMTAPAGTVLPSPIVEVSKPKRVKVVFGVQVPIGDDE